MVFQCVVGDIGEKLQSSLTIFEFEKKLKGTQAALRPTSTQWCILCTRKIDVPYEVQGLKAHVCEYMRKYSHNISYIYMCVQFLLHC